MADRAAREAEGARRDSDPGGHGRRPFGAHLFHTGLGRGVGGVLNQNVCGSSNKKAGMFALFLGQGTP